MLEGIVTIILSAIMTALGFLVVRWLTSVDQKLQELEDGLRSVEEQCRLKCTGLVTQAEFANVVKELRAADGSRRMAIDRLDRDIADLSRQNRLLNHIVQSRSESHKDKDSQDGKSQ